MGSQTTFANGRGIVHKGSGGMSVIAPDVCKTPPVGTPIPYPNIGKASDLTGGPTTVTNDGQMLAVKGAKLSTSYGDEAGVGGGLKSQVNRGECEFVSYSFDVFCEGKNVVRVGDALTQNKENAVGGIDMGEGVAMSGDHKEGKCPFCCEKQPKKPYKTYPGKENNGGILGRLLANPGKLTVEQVGARPKDGDPEKGNQSDVEPAPDPDTTYPIWIDCKGKGDEGDGKNTFGIYSSEAHHLISGKQALRWHKFEGWICKELEKGEEAGDRKEILEEDTGYSVNNAANGFWCPSIPKGFRKIDKGYKFKRSWGSLDDSAEGQAIRRDAAFRAMRGVKIQFHCGPHDIDGADGYKKYNEYLIDRLNKLFDEMEGFSKTCPVCGKNKKKEAKYTPTVRANKLLDRLSFHMKCRITGEPKDWVIFISRLAKDLYEEEKKSIKPEKSATPTLKAGAI
jgi:hypothetical protein